MNPLTNVRNQNKINERELQHGTAGDDRRSWHAKYRDSAWIFTGGLPFELSEGDVISIFSQYGEIVNINLIRDHKTGKFRGFGFICYDDQRSTTLAVDNFNGTKILGRTIRVDHVENYRVPKERGDVDEETKRLWMEGCAPDIVSKPSAGVQSEIKDEKPKIEPRRDFNDPKPRHVDTKPDDRRPEKEERHRYRSKEKRSEKKSEKRHRSRGKEEKKKHKKRRRPSSSSSEEDRREKRRHKN